VFLRGRWGNEYFQGKLKKSAQGGYTSKCLTIMFRTHRRYTVISFSGKLGFRMSEYADIGKI